MGAAIFSHYKVFAGSDVSRNLLLVSSDHTRSEEEKPEVISLLDSIQNHTKK